MDKTLAQNLAKKFQIDVEQITREEYEMLFLKELFESKIGKNLIFKGGTALRLCYGSPRFSQDLDFSLKGKINKASFNAIIKNLPRQFSSVVLKDLFVKKFTFFALLKIREEFLPRSFSIKVEISQRKEAWKENKNFKILVVKSEITPLTFLGQVATLEKILEDKLDILQRRKEPRDFFDIWFVKERLKKGVKIPQMAMIKQQQLKRDLHKLLPKPWWQSIDKINDLWKEKQAK